MDPGFPATRLGRTRLTELAYSRSLTYSVGMDFKELLEKPVHAAGREFVPFVITLSSLLWGLLLAGPISAFDGSVGYSFMADIAPEYAWGWVFLTVSGACLHGIITSKNLLVKYTARALFFMWVFVDIMYTSALPDSAWWPLLFAYALIFGWTSIHYDDSFDI